MEQKLFVPQMDPKGVVQSKVTGSTNPINVVKSVEKGLKSLRDPLAVARDRGITIKELFG